ncbi:enolase C-terminal domain-like protein [Paraburkholderia bryophila]|uniref:enolase C-terminal domain-like protein n=1 Tax=Burkholderiaceae TaxID=119060 RepID=UPI000554F269|nr:MULTISPECIES: enolase C-terminal domain-like protein [Burkholderiaceae]
MTDRIASTGGSQAIVTALRASAYRIPTDAPEADGTFAWHATTLVVVEVDAAGHTGIGYTYSDASIVALIRDTLGECVLQHDAWDIRAIWQQMQRQVRNLGRAGLAATAISAVDCALWDLKAKLLGLPLVRLLGAARDTVPIYGSGGFTTYSDKQMREQLAGWVERDGCRWVKIKIGSEPEKDPARVETARAAIGTAGLFVDANGAFTPQPALHWAQRFAEQRVEWFEEPVSSDDPAGLHFVREHAPAGMEIAAGEYGYTLDDFRQLLAAGSVDVLQADVSRCGGVTGFMQAADLCDAFHVPLSAHCAPALHLHVACAAPRLRHQEWFHDHVRIESMLFDGAPRAAGGVIAPDLSRPGCGLEFKARDAASYRID